MTALAEKTTTDYKNEGLADETGISKPQRALNEIIESSLDVADLGVVPPRLVLLALVDLAYVMGVHDERPQARAE